MACELPYIEAEGAADRRVIHVDHLEVHAQVACVRRIIISATDEFFRVSIIAEDIGGGAGANGLIIVWEFV